VLIHSVFASIQGEGWYQGIPTAFIRVAGCNLAEEFNSPCSYCDAPNAWFRNQGVDTPIKQIIEEVQKLGLRDICLTGGEPLWHDEWFGLSKKLFELGHHITIETNGSIEIDQISCAEYVLDIKCPSSGNDTYNQYNNLSKLKQTDQLKFVVGGKSDFEFALSILDNYETKARILFSPVHGIIEARELAEWLIENKLPYKLSLQLHRYLNME